jgi:aspartyl-tRNA(Asn)/glutamyl-tRNA(Gln) amidotransferase subunit C
MVVNDTLINRLSKLSSLQIKDDKKEKLKIELEDIVNFVKNLNEIDVSNIDATFTTVQGGAILREDVVLQDKDIPNYVLKHSPKNEDGYFIVPKIIE